MEITIELPDDIGERLTQTIDNLPRQTLESLVVEAYRKELITTAEVGRILTLASRWEVDAFLKKKEAYLHYNEADFQKDRETFTNLIRT